MPWGRAAWHPDGQEDAMKQQYRSLLLAAGLFAALAGFEQWRAAELFDIWHVLGDLFEWALLAGAVGMTVHSAARTREFRLERLELIGDLAAAEKEGARWRAAVATQVSGLSRAIATQFQAWALTDAEADVAGLMIKGLSQRDIAAMRQCSEVTVRQHATMVYRKSGLANRAQLTAFFLEDLLAGPGDPPAKTRSLVAG
jgi:DNA-binding CsgD family transcriptional regulator